MNIFVLPSWYPSADFPTSGIFVKEQVEEIAAASEKLTFGISLFDQVELLTPRKPLTSLKYLRKSLFSKQHGKKVCSGVFTYYRGALKWSPRFFSGGLTNILRVNFKNLRAFEKDVGDVNLIHAHVSFPGGYVAYLLSKRTGIPYVLSEHMGPFPFPSYKRKGILTKIKKALDNASRVISPSNSHAEDIRKCSDRDIAVIPNFIRTTTMAQSTKTDICDKFLFVFIGGNYQSKGIGDLLLAIRKIRDQLLEAEISFTIAGDNNDQAFRKLAREYQIEELIDWKGQLSRDKVKETIRRADCFVLPSHYESFGIVLIEAMSMGIPLMASKCGGPEDIINSKVGVLFESHNPSSLADAILSIYEKRHDWNSEVIREEFRKRFSPQAVVPKYLEVYREIVDQEI